MNAHNPGTTPRVVVGRCAMLVLCGAVAVGACAASGVLPGRQDETHQAPKPPQPNAASRAVAQSTALTGSRKPDHAATMLAQSGSGPSSGSNLRAAPFGSNDPVLSRGEQLFDKNCALCHGENGDGGGKFAYLMNPRPRNLRQGNFKLSTTQNQVPSDADLFRTISNGMPGSAMPPWGHLPKSDINALVAFVRAIYVEGTRDALNAWVSEGTITKNELPSVLAERTTPGPPLVIPPEPPFDEIHWFRGRRLYLENCASCHGVNGEPVADAVKFDAEGYPVPPRSFVNGIFKGGSQGHQLYARIWKGMKGTPMPASEGVYTGEEMWDIIHYVQSLMRQGAQERAQLKQGTFVAPRVSGDLPAGPMDSAWEQARPLYVALTPLWWDENRIEGLVVQALHNGKELALRLSWIDPTVDDRAVKQSEFRDAVAIQFSLTSDPPFYMGSAGEHGGVNLWMWKADRQADIVKGYQDVDAAFPYRAIDRYPEQDYRLVDMSVTEWPHESILKHDPQFVTAWGAGNLVANPNLKTPVECLVAHGPGTLSGKPVNAQRVQGQAVYERGLWYVQIQRSMELPYEHGVQDERVFKPGDYLPVSFAIWNGSAGDRDGKKNISIWQKLVIE